MKTLKRNEEFRRMPDSSKKDREVIDSMVDSGWSFSAKKEWKEWKSQFEKIKEKEKPSKSKKDKVKNRK